MKFSVNFQPNKYQVDLAIFSILFMTHTFTVKFSLYDLDIQILILSNKVDLNHLMFKEIHRKLLLIFSHFYFLSLQIVSIEYCIRVDIIKAAVTLNNK